MPCGIIGRTGPGMRQLVGLGDRSTGRGTFGANLGRAVVTNGDIRVRRCLNRRSCGLGLVRAVGRGTAVLDGVHVVQGEVEVVPHFHNEKCH